MQKSCNNKCSSKCIYFPQEVYVSASKQYRQDRNGVKRSSVVAKCLFDDHTIKKMEKCENFRTNSPKKIMQNKFLCLIGMSSSGKDYALEYIANKGISRAISHTTRPMRNRETDCKEYYFTNNEDFLEKLENDYFIEHRVIEFGVGKNKKTYYYGISKLELKNDNRVIILDTNGYNRLCEYCGKENVVGVYIDCSYDLRKKRAKRRGNFSKKDFLERENIDKQTINIEFAKQNCNYIIDNNKDKQYLENCIDEILKKEGMIF